MSTKNNKMPVPSGEPLRDALVASLALEFPSLKSVIANKKTALQVTNNVGVTNV
jgi:hypothetical protein